MGKFTTQDKLEMAKFALRRQRWQTVSQIKSMFSLGGRHIGLGRILTTLEHKGELVSRVVTERKGKVKSYSFRGGIRQCPLK